MNTQINAIIFDMDGVIIDSELLHYQVEQQIFRQYGIVIPESTWKMFIGKTERVMLAHIVEHFGNGRFSIDDMIEAKYRIFPQLLAENLQPIPGSLEFIRYVRTQYRKLALTTSSEKSMQETVFEIFTLHPYFDVVVTGSEVTNGKPHPEPYLKTVAALDMETEQCLVIEDSTNGIASAKAAGCRVAGLTTSFSQTVLMQAGADFVIDSFAALRKCLKNA